MNLVSVLYEDRWGAIIDRVAADHLELRWYDGTSEMSKDEFQEWLTKFQQEVGTSRRAGVLVDATRFRMAASNQDASWREEHLVPRYNAAGVRRFAFLMPDGMPAIGGTPRREGAAEYPTAYFDRRDDALRWLAEE